ncbi:MAG: histone deacetylase family protein [Sideroxydans sp.]|nr:histone deacetylase family protein [Sideroxydans sp.]
MQTAYINHPDCLRHDMGAHHPECPARLGAIEDQLIASGLLPYLQQHDAPLATFEQLARVHTPHYIESIQAAAPAQGLIYLDPDTAMGPHSLNAALRAAGAAVLATELVLEHKVENAFCAIRPPGHHAEPGKAMGFCIFNNVAVAAAHAMEKFGLRRVAIVDFDVHHGNGTEAMFRDDPRVMLCSTFQHPYYPYSGADSSNAHIINVPLPAGTDGTIFREKITERWLPALDDFQPEMLFVSAGFDGHREDDMAQFNLLEADYSWVTQQVKDIAGRHARKRIVSVLEGGYELHALGRSVLAHLKVLSGL